MQPIYNRVFVEVLPDKKEEQKGLIIQPMKQEPMYRYGKVLAVGDGVYQMGKRIKMDIEVGDVVIFPRHGAAFATEVDAEMQPVKMILADNEVWAKDPDYYKDSEEKEEE